MVAHHVLVPQLTERLRDAENDSMAKIAELEKQLSQARKELETLRVSCGCGLGQAGVWAGPGFPRSLLRLSSPYIPEEDRGGVAVCQRACRWALILLLGLAGAGQRVKPHGHCQTYP